MQKKDSSAQSFLHKRRECVFCSVGKRSHLYSRGLRICVWYNFWLQCFMVYRSACNDFFLFLFSRASCLFFILQYLEFALAKCLERFSFAIG